MEKIVPVLLAGGGGSRLWPVSRESLPKQFQLLTGSLSTFQQALQRISDPDLFEDPVVVTSEAFEFFATRQARIVNRRVSFVLEPCRRDTAAAIAVATLLVEQLRPKSPILVLAADHVILDDGLFLDAVRAGLKAAHTGKIVVFGLAPTAPKTNFGYIRPGAPVGNDDDVRLVDGFFEKPEHEAALSYLREGYLWNSGNFLFRSDVMIAEFGKHAPDVLAAARASIATAQSERGIMRPDEVRFSASPKISIDYAVMQKSRNVAVVAGRFRWSDIGSWDAIWEILPHDEDGNAALGHSVMVESRNCLAHSVGILTTVIGGTDLVVVATGDAVLVCPRDRVQGIKGLVEKLQAAGAKEASSHLRDVQPWGHVETVLEGVRRLVIEPEGTMSARPQSRQAVHWIVLKGTATMVVDGVERTVREGGSLHVPPAAMHQIKNSGQSGLEIIEVKAGICDEDGSPRSQNIRDWKRREPMGVGTAALR